METELQNIEKRDLVRHNRLVNGKVKLKAKSYDLIRSISTLVDYNDTDFWTYELEVSKLGIDYKKAKEYIRDIMRNPIEIKNDEKRTFECYSWCSSLKYKNGFITFKLDPEMKEFMLQIRGNFTKTFEKYILPMQSIYAKRIYEMLIQNIDYGCRKFNLKELQELLDVPKSLRSYSRFKEKALLVAIKEINKHTDIYIPVDTENLTDSSWTRLQCGKTRKIIFLNFEFRKKSDKSFTKTQKIEEPISQKNIDEQWKLTQHWIDDLMVEFGVAQTANQQLINEFELYLYEQEKVFSQFCIDNNKQYEDMNVSFKRHLKNAEAYKIDFFARLR
jgi:plasmid replication initiation protein